MKGGTGNHLSARTRNARVDRRNATESSRNDRFAPAALAPTLSWQCQSRFDS